MPERLLTGKNIIRSAGAGMIFLGTACGSPAPAENTPTPEPTPAATSIPTPEITITPTPDPQRTAAYQRECNLGQMDTLQIALKRFVQPQQLVYILVISLIAYPDQAI